MLAGADSALHLLILQLFLDTPLVWRSTFWPAVLSLLRLDALPVAARSELDVLAYTRRVWLRALGLPSLEAKFGPGATLSDGRVYLFFVDRGAGLAGDFHFPARVVYAVGDCGLGAVFVDSCGG